MLGFVPKVASRFHITQEIILMFYSQNSLELSPLDVGHLLKAYVDTTAELRKSAHIFIIPNGAQKNLRAGKVITS